MSAHTRYLPRTLPDLLDQAGTDRVALYYRDEPVSFGALSDESRRVAGGLRDLAVGPGDRVALWLPSVPAYLAFCFACARLGAIAVAVNTRYRAAEVEDVVGRTGARVLVYWPGFRGIDFNDILADVDLKALKALECVVVYAEDEPPGTLPLAGKRQLDYEVLRGAAPLNASVATPDLPVKIFTTSGTTKAPKFVLHSQASLSDHAHDVVQRFGLDAPDTVGAVALPLGGVFGFNGALSLLAAQRPAVLLPVFQAEHFAAQLERYRVTQWNGADEMVHQLLQTDVSEACLRRQTHVGFATFNVALAGSVERAQARGLRLVSLWGMSEMQALAAMRDPQADVEERKRMGGELTSPHARVRARDPESGRLLPPGEAGELEIAGPSRMLGYFQDEAATADTLTDDGFVRTGDLGKVENEHRFEFMARMGDVMRLGGFLVSPAEIEEEIKTVAGVADVQVVAAPTDKGQRSVAFVIAEAGGALSPQDVRDHCASRMARYKVPERVVQVAEFPVTLSANGTKIQRARLREMATSLLADKS